MAKRAAVVKTPDVVEAGSGITSEDVQLAVTAGEAVKAFMVGVRQFFMTAATLEQQALSTLDQAKTWQKKPPATEAEDLELQKFIRSTSAQNKVVVEHWKITAVVHQLHKRMTGRRAIATDALDTANEIGNALHATYVREEAARVAAENERRRIEAEKAEQARRDAEQLALEEEAVRREEESPKLTAREQTFLDLYWSTENGPDSARRAGFKGNPLKGGSIKEAERLLKLPKIQAALEAKKSAEAIRQQAEALKRQPVVADFVETRPQIAKAAGSFERETHSAELLDEAALIEAIFAGKYGIPRTILKIDAAALNAQARDLKALINKWPGVRYKCTPRVI